MYKRIVTALLVFIFCASTVHAGLFSAKVPESKVIEDAIAPFSVSGDKSQCTFAPYPGTYKVQIINRYTKKFDNEDWQCVEIKVTFTGNTVYIGGTRPKKSIRAFRFEYAYIQRGNRWERKGIGQIDYCLNEWEYTKIDPSEQINLSFSKLGREVDDFIAKQKYGFPRKKVGIPCRANSPSYPYEADVTLEVDTRDGKPYKNNVHLTLRFSAPDEAWELSTKVAIDPR